jgi:hypothetical protein
MGCFILQGVLFLVVFEHDLTNIFVEQFPLQDMGLPAALMRPSEVFQMTVGDIDTTSVPRIWLYRLASHKTHAEKDPPEAGHCKNGKRYGGSH